MYALLLLPSAEYICEKEITCHIGLDFQCKILHFNGFDGMHTDFYIFTHKRTYPIVPIASVDVVLSKTNDHKLPSNA